MARDEAPCGDVLVTAAIRPIEEFAVFKVHPNEFCNKEVGAINNDYAAGLNVHVVLNVKSLDTVHQHAFTSHSRAPKTFMDRFVLISGNRSRGGKVPSHLQVHGLVRRPSLRIFRLLTLFLHHLSYKRV